MSIGETLKIHEYKQNPLHVCDLSKDSYGSLTHKVAQSCDFLAWNLSITWPDSMNNYDISLFWKEIFIFDCWISCFTVDVYCELRLFFSFFLNYV